MPASYQQQLDCHRSLASTDCPGCVNTKIAKQSFCRACYSSLPGGLKKRLYNPEGYVETFYEALPLVKKRIFGFDVTIKVRAAMLGHKELNFHIKGTENAARRAAKLKSGFIEIVRLEPLTCEQYTTAFGYGRM